MPYTCNTFSDCVFIFFKHTYVYSSVKYTFLWEKIFSQALKFEVVDLEVHFNIWSMNEITFAIFWITNKVYFISVRAV